MLAADEFNSATDRMIDADDPASSRQPDGAAEPPRSRLRRILEERPEARPRLGRAVAVLLGTGLIAFAALGALLIWHLVRRGRLIRERLTSAPACSFARAPWARVRSAVMNLKPTFRPHERLKDPEDFRRVFERRRFESDGVLMVYGVENDRDHARLGISRLSQKGSRGLMHATGSSDWSARRFDSSKAELPSGIDLVVLPQGKNVTFNTVRRSLVALGCQLAGRLKRSR